ncbi:MAG: hypothetical protein KBC94_01705 [Pseudacidovorax sp.]|uniref:hypothetical protein n=1 Tax=Pseudacidovorax sp. TaxID=1934311 RepID=UPI001B6C1999|nr:hypothetical protein [Pseudacidovorax sp.]MBP6893109.1 hypothetical protein [Pseudacidovorax sp.]
MHEFLSNLLKTSAPGTVILTTLNFIVVVSLLWHLTAKVAGAAGNQAATNINRLIAIIGGLCGLIIGFALSPFSGAELKQFRFIAGLVSAFLSGYVLSKLDRFLENALFPVDAPNHNSWARLGLFVAAFLLVSSTVFLSRLYAFRGFNA